MRTTLSVILTGLLLCVGLNPAFSSEKTQSKIEIYTEDYKPLYFQDEAGNILGITTNLLREIATAADIEIELHMRPFKRGLNAVINNKDHCFLALWRTALREPDFTWVGPLETDGFALFALADSDISLASVEESFSYPTGAVSGWTSTMELQKAGHPNLVLVYEDALNVNMLKKDHTKLWLGGLISAPFVAAQLGVEIKKVLTIQRVDLALACNPKTDKALVDRLQEALIAHRKKIQHHKTQPTDAMTHSEFNQNAFPKHIN